MSDISEFAAWEARHHPLALDQQEEAMARLSPNTEVWGNGVGGSQKIKNGKGFKGKTVIPSSQSQDASFSLREGERGGDLVNRLEEVEDELDDLNAFDAPPSSQPRIESADEDSGDVSSAEVDTGVADLRSKVTLGEELDIAEISSPSSTASAFGTHYDYDDLDKMSTSSVSINGGQENPDRLIRQFAHDHPSWPLPRWTEEEGEEFTNDVFHFAKAAGLEDDAAYWHAIGAQKKWVEDRGVTLDFQWYPPGYDAIEPEAESKELAIIEQTHSEPYNSGDELELEEIDAAIRVLEKARALLKRKRASLGAEEGNNTPKVPKLTKGQESKRQRIESITQTAGVGVSKTAIRKQAKKQRIAERNRLRKLQYPKPVLHSAKEWYKDDEPNQPKIIKGKPVPEVPETQEAGDDVQIEVKEGAEFNAVPGIDEQTAEVSRPPPPKTTELSKINTETAKLEAKGVRSKKAKKAARRVEGRALARLPAADAVVKSPETKDAMDVDEETDELDNTSFQAAVSGILPLTDNVIAARQQVDFPNPVLPEVEHSVPASSEPLTLIASKSKPPPQPQSQKLSAEQKRKNKLDRKNAKMLEAQLRKAEKIAHYRASLPGHLQDMTTAARDAVAKAAPIIQKTVIANAKRAAEIEADPAQGEKSPRRRKRNKNRLAEGDSKQPSGEDSAANLAMQDSTPQTLDPEVVEESSVSTNVVNTKVPEESPQTLDVEQSLQEEAETKKKSGRKARRERKSSFGSSGEGLGPTVVGTTSLDTKKQQTGELDVESSAVPNPAKQVLGDAPSTSKTKRRDRGRKSKTETELEVLVPVVPIESDPLGERADTNSEKPKNRSRRGVKRLPLVRDQASASGDRILDFTDFEDNNDTIGEEKGLDVSGEIDDQELELPGTIGGDDTNLPDADEEDFNQFPDEAPDFEISMESTHEEEDNNELQVQDELGQTVSGVLATPFQVPKNAEDDEVFHTAQTQRGESPIDVPDKENDDNGSVFSLKQYGSQDGNDTGDDLDGFVIQPRTRRMNFSEDAEPLNEGIPPPRGRSRKRSSSVRAAAVGNRSVSVVRDSHGRFSSSKKRIVEDNVESTPATISKRRRSSSKPNGSVSVDSRGIELVRDSHGRFSSRTRAAEPNESKTPIVSSKTRRALSKPRKVASEEPVVAEVVRDSHGRFSSSKNRVKPSASPKAQKRQTSASRERAAALVRDSNGRFASVKNGEGPSTKKKRSLSRSERAVSSQEATVELVRDSSGRFAKKWKGDELDPESQSRSRSRSSPKETRSEALIQALEEVASLAHEDEDVQQAEIKEKKKGKKKKKEAVKSHFFTPDSTPLKSASTVKVKEEGEIGESAKTPSKRKSSSKKFASTQSNTREDDAPSSQRSASKSRSPGGLVSCIPFPPLSAPNFGLIQEKLALDPFRLLIAVTFLIRTHGKHAIPVFYALMEKYPTPESLVAADKDDIVPIIRHLGLQNQRASTYQAYAQIWLDDKPTKGKRYAVRGYPTKGSGRNIKKGEVLSDTDPRDAWEIGHMTQGPYAIDSWRIFCRDILRGLSTGWDGEGNADENFQPEWMRVLPEDKELRAYLRWMWLKIGFDWDPFTGDKKAAEPELMKAAQEGRIAWDGFGGIRILDHAMDFTPGLSQVGNLGDEMAGSEDQVEGDG